ncbi:MAG: hypothetical protein KGR16_02450 [Verrucomicrobia bacterium]|nr:hypothetical protein [Verrucomicrobiota bacterium]
MHKKTPHEPVPKRMREARRKRRRDPEQVEDPDLELHQEQQPGDYLPSGFMLATIYKALLEAEDASLKMQQDQAQAEQEYYSVLGGVSTSATGSTDISKGLIAMAANSIVQAGNNEAEGLEKAALGNAIAAGITGAFTGLTIAHGANIFVKNRGLDNDLEKANAFRNELHEGVDANLTVSAPNQVTDESLESIVSRFGKNEQGEFDREGISALRAARPDAFGRVQEMAKENAEKIQKEISDNSDAANKSVQMNQTGSVIAQAATGSYANYGQGAAKSNAAGNNASAQVQKQVQDMDTAAARTLDEQSRASAQQAMQTADALAQVAQSQVQSRV